MQRPLPKSLLELVSRVLSHVLWLSWGLSPCPAPREWGRGPGNFGSYHCVHRFEDAMNCGIMSQTHIVISNS